MGEMEINCNKITPVSGISGNSESTLGEVTLTMATAGQPITYTAEVIGGAGALVGNPTLRRLGASILTDWFENGDGLLVLNTKDAMDGDQPCEVLQDPPHRFWTLHPALRQRSEREGSKSFQARGHCFLPEDRRDHLESLA